MKVFVSWSGELSHKVALILKGWFPNVIQTVELYVSSEDVDKGTRWFADVSGELEEANFGIVCLTRENMSAPWILFESGAISKSLSQSRVTPLLIDLSPADLKGPLVQFQATTTSQADMLKLVRAVNSCLGDNRLKDVQVETAFVKWWPDFEADLKRAIEQTKGSRRQKEVNRSDREILEEVLQLTRTVVRSLPGTDLTEETNPVESELTKRLNRALEERGKPLLTVVLDGAQRIYLHGDELRIVFLKEHEHLAQTLRKPDNLEIVREVSKVVVGRDVDVRVLYRKSVKGFAI